MALLERFRELNQRQLRELLDRLDADELEVVDRSLDVFGRALDRGRATSHHPDRQKGAPHVSRLSRIALSKRSVTLLFAGALFIAGISAWGSLKQELLPDIDFPVITVVTPFPGAGVVRRRPSR